MTNHEGYLIFMPKPQKNMMLLVEFAPKQALGCWMLPQWQLPNVTAAPCLLKLQAPS
jgi:hypothetical protein